MCVYACSFVISVFFFKQKTAYEMRISDWSSDVCSSDLIPWALGLIATRSLDGVVPGIHELVARNRQRIENGIAAHAALQAVRADRSNILKQQAFQALADDLGYGLLTLRYVDDPAKADAAIIDRSEEHTSELQSLMRISYA